MTRMSKQGKRRAMSPRRCRAPSVKTGPKKESGFKPHENAAPAELANTRFIPKMV